MTQVQNVIRKAEGINSNQAQSAANLILKTREEDRMRGSLVIPPSLEADPPGSQPTLQLGFHLELNPSAPQFSHR